MSRLPCLRPSRSESRRAARRSARSGTRRRGAAYMEAILLIFFMIIIFAGVIYLGRYFEAQQRALGVARRCAWTFSFNACTMDSDCGKPGHHACLPAVCDGVFGPVQEEPNDDLMHDISGAQQRAQTSNGNSIAQGEAGNSKNLRAGVDAKMGPMLALVVGQSVTAVARGEIELPSSLPDAEKSIDVSYYLPCNLKHENPIDTAISLFKDLLGGAAL
jgi:hypothetical protein